MLTVRKRAVFVVQVFASLLEQILARNGLFSSFPGQKICLEQLADAPAAQRFFVVQVFASLLQQILARWLLQFFSKADNQLRTAYCCPTSLKTQPLRETKRPHSVCPNSVLERAAARAARKLIEASYGRDIAAN